MIYFASPLFNERERAFNAQLAARFGQVIDVFLPQRDGTLLTDMLAAGVALPVAERRVFTQDCEAMRNSSALVAVLDGAYIDEGVAFEIGFMSALNRPCIGFQTDVRRALPSGNNPMIGCGLEAIFSSENDVIAWLEDNSDRLRRSNQLRA